MSYLESLRQRLLDLFMKEHRPNLNEIRGEALSKVGKATWERELHRAKCAASKAGGR